MAYKKTNDKNIIIRIEDSANIPTDEKNRDYQQFLEWEANGGIIQEADPIPEIQ